MSSAPYTYAGAKLYVSTEPKNNDANGDWSGLTFEPISNVGNIGAYGLDTNMVSYATLDRSMSLKGKGVTDGGNFTIQCADSSGDAGQDLLTAAGKPDVADNYVIKIEFPNGKIHYLRGPVGGPNHPGGGSEDFVVNEYTVGVNEIDYGDKDEPYPQP